MTHEDMERTMQFILEHQAKFSADIGSINDTIGKISKTLAQRNEAIVDLVRISRALVDNQMAHESQMGELRTDVQELVQVSRSLIDNQMAHEGQMSQMRAETQELVQVSRSLIDSQMAHERQMNENQMAHERQMSELRTEMRELAKAQRETDGRLSTFITIVGRYLSGHNGGAHQA